MKNKLLASAFVFLLVIIGSGLAKLLNWYNDYWFTDVILHTLSGLGFGLFWLAVQKETTFWLLLLMGAVSFAVFGSVLWEFGEFLAWKYVAAYTPFYSPNLSDALEDIFCGLIGGIMAMVALMFKERR